MWATIYVESWKRVQKRLCYIWNCSDGSFADKDEREEDYKFFNKLNIRTKKFEKMGKYLRPKVACGYTTASIIALGIIIFAIIFYRLLTIDLKYNEDGTKKKLTNKETILSYAYTAGYTGVVMGFGTMYKKLANAQTYAENHRYHSQYTATIIFRLFWINFINFYLPFFMMIFED